MSTGTVFDEYLLLSYLGLPENYEPSPEAATIAFLTKHLTQLPPHLLQLFSHIISAKERTVIPTIRNRRLKYVNQQPPGLEYTVARSRWPNLWQGKERHGDKEVKEEKEWAEECFISGTPKYVGKLGDLLSGYEEERQAACAQSMRPKQDEFILEEEESSESDDGDADDIGIEEESPEEVGASFGRLIKERFIYGLLEGFEYDEVDWDESLDDEGEREAEQRWFDNEDGVDE